MHSRVDGRLGACLEQEDGCMRIALVGPASPWRGGIAHFNDLLARELAREHEVSVLTFTRQYPSLLFPGKSQKHPGEQALDVGAIECIDSIAPWTWRSTAARIREWSPELLVFRYWMPFFAPCFGSILRGAVKDGRPETVVVADNVVPHERRILDTTLTRWFLSRPDRFVVMADAVRQDLLRFRPDARVTLAPHPLYGQFGDAMDRGAARRQLDLDDDAEILLFFGFIRRYKGLDLLLDAMPRIVHERPRARLLVVGEFYDDEAPYRAQVREAGLEAVVRFVPDYVANDEVAPWFSAADVVVLPYRHATQSGIIPVAFHMGRTVISTRVGGLGEVIDEGRTGLLVPAGDPVSLADEVIRFFAQELGEAMEAAVRAERPRFSWRHFAGAVLGANE
jgi:glycosyltransferase involved in cell wall biosynthesis